MQAQSQPEVYKHSRRVGVAARQTSRVVILKVDRLGLVVRDDDRVIRFQREAHVLASLNNPNTTFAQRSATPLHSYTATLCSNVLHERGNLHELDARAHTVETGYLIEKLFAKERFGCIL